MASSRTTPAKHEAINIVGAGVFGLSTALHLARRGYTNVTVFDRQPYDETLYSYFKGCDAASADAHKIIRSGYGGTTIYQDLTTDAITTWRAWNEELKSGKTVPPGMSTADRLWAQNGTLALTDGDELPEFNLESIRNMEAAGLKGTQFVTTDPTQLEAATALGFNMEPFRRRNPVRPNVGVMDTTGGTAFADKACRFVLHKTRGLGVKFVLDPTAGALEALVYGENNKRVVGIRTRDGKTHNAVVTLLACGSWTPALLPALDDLCEATAGSVALLQVPRDSPLFDRFSAESFPSWTYKMRDGAEGGLYGMPRDDNGWVKIGYRGTKYTNPMVQADGKERSVPVTRYFSPYGANGVSGKGKGQEKQEDGVAAAAAKAAQTGMPETAARVIRRFVDEFLPELGEAGIKISVTRLCWYNDSFDNHLTIDWVPDTEGLMVATSGSGHAFKYLPNIGDYVVDIMEGVGLDRDAIKSWKWRRLGDGEKPVNVIMQGSKGPNLLRNTAVIPDTEMGK